MRIMARKQAKINPFLSSLQVRCKWDVKITPTHGYGTLYESTPKEVDHRVSVYTERLLELFTQLDKTSLRLLAYICAHLRWGQDYLQLDPDKVADEMEVSRATYYRAIDALSTKVIVKRETSNNTYFINPMYIYCGKRHVDFKEHIVFVNSNPLDKALDHETLPAVGESVPLTTIPGTDWVRDPHLVVQS